MKIKKPTLVVFLLAVLIGLVLLYGYYRRNLGGVLPVVGPTPSDISELIENAGENDSARSENLTGFPLLVNQGYKVSIFAKDLGQARVLMEDPKGVLLVTVPEDGVVYALPDTDKNGEVDQKKVVVNGLNRPHGIAFGNCTKLTLNTLNSPDYCDLYIAETNRVAKFTYNLSNSKAEFVEKIIDLPAGGRHWSRTILITEIAGEKKLITSIGSSCDVCVEADWRRASVLISDLDGGNLETFASGLRNSVFMRKHPQTGEIWATEMGRDFLGDDLPPDEINILEKGANYGWPYCYGNRVHDSRFDQKEERKEFCNLTNPSHIDLQAHSAPLGLNFIRDDDGSYDLLVAYHGSWNRSEPTGYKIVRFDLDGNGDEISRSDFISGWLTEGNRVVGRPVDILTGSTGSIFVSDDKAGVVYKIDEL